MTGVVQGFRWALLGAGDPPLAALVDSNATVLVLVSSGLVYLRRNGAHPRRRNPGRALSPGKSQAQNQHQR